jgi:hypothetical protein
MTAGGHPTGPGRPARPSDPPGAPRSSRPPFLARHLVALSLCLLPNGSTRHRYRQELLAELYGLSAREASTCALGIAVNAPALRRAVLTDADATPEGTMHTHRPLACRLNIHHRYRIQQTKDGSRYLHCPRCGKDYFSNTYPGAGYFNGGA